MTPPPRASTCRATMLARYFSQRLRAWTPLTTAETLTCRVVAAASLSLLFLSTKPLAMACTRMALAVLRERHKRVRFERVKWKYLCPVGFGFRGSTAACLPIFLIRVWSVPGRWFRHAADPPPLTIKRETFWTARLVAPWEQYARKCIPLQPTSLPPSSPGGLHLHRRRLPLGDERAGLPHPCDGLQDHGGLPNLAVPASWWGRWRGWERLWGNLVGRTGMHAPEAWTIPPRVSRYVYRCEGMGGGYLLPL